MEIKIGKPNKQFFSGEFEKNLNEPIFSTVAGLLLIGIDDEKFTQHQENLIKKQNDKKNTDFEDKTQKKGKENTFNIFRRRLGSMFNEEDNTLD